MFDKRVKAAKEMLRELEDQPQSNGMMGNLVGGFITILVGVSIINQMKQNE